MAADDQNSTENLTLEVLFEEKKCIDAKIYKAVDQLKHDMVLQADLMERIQTLIHLESYDHSDYTSIVSPSDDRKMFLIESGAFPQGNSNEMAYLESFYLDAYPVTNADYQKFTEATGHQIPNHWQEGFAKAFANHPVVFVDYQDASAYAEWAGKRLPTQQEWEAAARGLTGLTFPWGNAATHSKCNARESQIGQTTPVDKYRSGASPYGVYDMAGNVWEWCDSVGALEDRRILKGGSFSTPFIHAKAYELNDADIAMKDDDTGFRCALTA